jgi:hypothetical protein
MNATRKIEYMNLLFAHIGSGGIGGLLIVILILIVLFGLLSEKE